MANDFAIANSTILSAELWEPFTPLVSLYLIPIKYMVSGGPDAFNVLYKVFNVLYETNNTYII